MSGNLILLLVAINGLAQIRCLVLCLVMKFASEETEGCLEGTAEIPKVVVQIATYREALAMPAMLQAVLAMDWPREQMSIQVLDDSVGGDARATEDVVERFAGRGVRIEYLNRGNRAGFKAGALNFGLTTARDTDLIAYFDADCRPRRNFLTRVAPYFADPRMAAVQARWEYPNSQESPLTIAQQAAFEYMFRYEFGIRTLLRIPVAYLGSAGVWRREAIEETGGWRVTPFTAEDVDMGYRVANSGWKVGYESSVLADNDAVEDILAFRAQQRRWARAVSRAGLDAGSGIARARWSRTRWLVEFTAGMPHATIPITLLTALLIAFQILAGSPVSELQNGVDWLFVLLVFVPPSILAMIFATRYFHPREWCAHVKLLAMAGPAAAATMTGFIFGLADLAAARRTEFVATPKAGQIAVVRGSRFRWLAMLYGPLVFDAVVAVLLLTASAVAFTRKTLNTALTTGALGAAFLVSLIQLIAAMDRHRAKLERR